MKKKKTKSLDTLVQDIYETIEVLADDKAIDVPEKMYEEFVSHIYDPTDEEVDWMNPLGEIEIL